MQIPAGFEPYTGDVQFVAFAGPYYRNDGRIGVYIEEKHCNAMGTCHGGMVCSVFDILLAVAAGYEEEDGRRLATLNLSVDFIAPIRVGAWVEGSAEYMKDKPSIIRPIHGVLRVDGRRVAQAVATYYLPPK